MPGKIPDIVIEGAQLMYLNFAGRESQFNREGDRNCCVMVDDENAQRLIDDGWNVKSTKVREPGDVPQRYLPFSVRYPSKDHSRVRPPMIVLITSRGRVNLDEDTVELLDQSDISNVDIIIRPYEWAVNGNTGVKAYLKALYVTLAENQFEQKYADIPEMGAGNQPRAIEAGPDEEIWDAEIVQEDTKELEA
jgi:hypothetical protein